LLDQKEESILLHIKNIFGVGNVKKTADIGVFRYNLGSFKSNSVTVDYFLGYPLKGNKNCFPKLEIYSLNVVRKKLKSRWY
jgi:hypothetical protein